MRLISSRCEWSGRVVQRVPRLPHNQWNSGEWACPNGLVASEPEGMVTPASSHSPPSRGGGGLSGHLPMVDTGRGRERAAAFWTPGTEPELTAGYAPIRPCRTELLEAASLRSASAPSAGMKSDAGT